MECVQRPFRFCFLFITSIRFDSLAMLTRDAVTRASVNPKKGEWKKEEAAEREKKN